MLMPMLEVRAGSAYWFSLCNARGNTVWVPALVVEVNGALMAINHATALPLDISDKRWQAAKLMSEYTFHRFLSKTYAKMGNHEKSMELYWKAMGSLTPDQHRSIIESKSTHAVS
jgi:hypothetical protein